jgi:hypothetical protein
MSPRFSIAAIIAMFLGGIAGMIGASRTNA